MKCKVILCYVIVYFSQIVVSIPYVEEDNKQRAYQTSNWKNTQIVPQQYYVTNVPRPHDVKSEYQHQNIHGLYENSHENFRTYNHPTLQSRTTEIQQVFNRMSDGGSQEYIHSNYRPRNPIVNAVSSAKTASIEERPLISNVRKPYRHFDHNENTERRHFPFRQQYHHTERHPSFFISRERELQHEREPIQEKEIHLEIHPIRKTELYEQDRLNKNEHYNPILENSDNIRPLNDLPVFNRPVHFESKSETFAVPTTAADKNEHASDFGSKFISLPHYEGYNVNDKPELPLLKNILGSNKNNHIVVIHANGTVDYLDNLDSVIQNNRNYHVIQPGVSEHSYNPHMDVPWRDNTFYEGKRNEPVVPILPIAYFESVTTTASTISRLFDNGLKNKLSSNILAKPLSSGSYEDVVTTTQETLPYISSKQFTIHDNDALKHDDIITISPIELATELVSTVPTPRKSEKLEHGDNIAISPLPKENISKESSIQKSEKMLRNHLITMSPTESVTERAGNVPPLDTVTKMVNSTVGIVTNNYNKNNKLITESTTATIYNIYNGTEISLDDVTIKDFLYQKPNVTQGNNIATTTTSNRDDDVIIFTNNTNIPSNVVVPHNKVQTDNVTSSYIQYTKYNTTIDNDSTTLSAESSLNITPDKYKGTTTTGDKSEISTTDDNKNDVLSTLKKSVNNSTQSSNKKIITQKNIPPNNEVPYNNFQTDNVTPSYIQHTEYNTTIKNDSTMPSEADSTNMTPNEYKGTKTKGDPSEISTTNDSKNDVLSTSKESISNSTQTDSFNQKVVTQTNDDNIKTAPRNSTEISEVNKNIDNHLLVTTTSSTSFTRNSTSTADSDDYTLESKRPNDIIVELIIPNDDQRDTVNLNVDFPTDDEGKNGQEQKTNDDASDSEDTLVFSINTENSKDGSEETPVKITRTAVVQMGDNDDKNFMIDLTNIKDKPVMWFKTTDTDFFEKVKNGEGECQIMYLFQVQPHLTVDRDTRTTIYENGTVIEEITETIFDKTGDSSPKITKTSKVIHPRDSPQ